MLSLEVGCLCCRYHFETSNVMGVYMELCFRIYGQGQCWSVIGRYQHLLFPTY